MERDFRNYVSTMVTIPRPHQEVIPRGINSKKHGTRGIPVKVDADALATIDAACLALSITRSSFMRWSGTYVAREILKQKEKFDQEG